MVKSKPGYRLKRRTATIEFDTDTGFEGLEVTIKLDLPMAAIFEFQGTPEDTPAEKAESMRMFARMALTGWNLQNEDGTDVPATEDGFLAQPFSLTTTIIKKWVEAATQPSIPLGTTSNNSKRSEANLMLLDD